MMDVLTVSDLRLPGGTSHSNAEEIHAQFRLGLTSELVHLNGGLSAAARGLNPRLERLIRDGLAHFAATPSSRRARLAIARHPAMISTGHDQLGPVEVDDLIMVVNATPVDWVGREHWRPEDVHEKAASVFGVEPVWAPIGPNARDAIIGRVPVDKLREEDWVNIIDVDHWWVDRSERARDRRPVVGRHSRASVQKWPEQPERDLVYPPDGRWEIRVLGWDPIVQDALGPPPASWSVERFGSVAPRDFLAGLDFFVYFHHPNLVEAFGRTILEAIASGLPAILPHHFEPLFGAAALYADPERVGDVVEALWADQDAYQTHVAVAGALVRHRFGYEAHGRRLAAILPGQQVLHLASATGSESGSPGTNGRVDERAGGLVLLDLAAPSGSRTDPIRQVTTSPIVAALTTDRTLTQQLPWCDVVPTAEDCSLPTPAWESLVAKRVATLLAAHPTAPVALVGDASPGPAVESVLAGRTVIRHEQPAGHPPAPGAS